VDFADGRGHDSATTSLGGSQCVHRADLHSGLVLDDQSIFRNVARSAMKVIVVPSDCSPEVFPELTDLVSEVVISLPASEIVTEWVFSLGIPVTIVTDTELDEETLENASELVTVADRDSYCVSLAQLGDLVLMGWSDTDKQYKYLQILASRGVASLDMADEYQELVVDAVPYIDEVISRVTAEVLKTVRAEMQEEFFNEIRNQDKQTTTGKTIP